MCKRPRVDRPRKRKYFDAMKLLIASLLFLGLVIAPVTVSADDPTDPDRESKSLIDKIRANIRDLEASLGRMEKTVRSGVKDGAAKTKEEISEVGDKTMEGTEKALAKLAADLRGLEAKMKSLREEKKKKSSK